MEPAFLQAKKIVQEDHGNCRSMNAWNEKSQKFARCTEQLKASISWLGEAFEDIENFVAGNINSTMPIEAQVGHLTINPNDRKNYESHGLETALQKLKAMSESITTSTTCSVITGCREKVSFSRSA